MRIIYKPEISSWSIFSLSGKGFEGEFWLLPLLVIFAISIFYFEGRGRIRQVYHVFLLIWHSLLTGAIIYGSTQSDTEVSFGTWGISVGFRWLVIPFILFFGATIVLIYQERKIKNEIPTFSWTKINLQPLIIALALSIVAFLFFRFGTGFNWLVKIAVGSTIIQWILITEAFGRPYERKIKKDLT
ncbi:hypothetical protein CA834_10195 [Winogradskyella aurantia]|uniref:Uncharacterized protein n=2 Tax=Winogradskyella aurantia TaxID=1915063 RepID=A0A265US04_9FLAO|nr:hypothetical protein CA834_10195 [Winogradskyella aurantia]